MVIMKLDKETEFEWFNQIYKDSDMTSMTRSFNVKPNKFANMGIWKRDDENRLIKNNTIEKLLKEISDSLPSMKDVYETLEEFISDVIKCRKNVTVMFDHHFEYLTDYNNKLLIMKSISIMEETNYIIICTNKQQLEMFQKIEFDGILGNQLIVEEGE